MNTQIIVNKQVHESRIAILEDGKLVELLVERPDQRRMVGNIYKGKVERVLPGIQSAFINIGMEKRAFLHISDVARYDPFSDSEIEEEEDSQQRVRPRKRSQFKNDNIKEWLTAGDEILVQITKEPMGAKGPRCTTEISLAGRFLVLMPGQKHVGVSRKIRSQRDRYRIRKIIRDMKPEGAGLIGRSVAEGQDKKALARDLEYLVKDLDKIKQKTEVFEAPALMYRDTGMAAGMVRDLFSMDMNEFVVDSKTEYEKIKAYTQKVVPSLKDRIKLYRGKKPIFDAFDVETQIENMLKRKIWVRKGAYIVIDNTEALISIDVNSGRNVGKGKTYEDNLLQVNLAAVDEIARQIRLRDLGGIIVIDFIDMEYEKNRQTLIDTFRKAMSDDRARHKILDVNDFGLVILTRQRVQQSVVERISDTCPTCGGLGVVFSAVTIIARIERWLMRAVSSRTKNFIIIVHPVVAGELFAEKAERLKELEAAYKVRLECFADPVLSPDDYIILDADTGEEMTDEFTGNTNGMA
ncbi:Rne/Rng family ribonuclease [bacterium]|nr:Rne/Rng family ribonuclease [bacterium]